jgi:hypothetical protein
MPNMWWGNKKGQERRVILAGATLLVNGAKEKRVKIRCRMELNGKAARLSQMPDWIVEAMTFVAKNEGMSVNDPIELNGYDIRFSDDTLFEKGSVMGPRCKMKSFSVYEAGAEDDKVVEMGFVISAPFSRNLWSWVGQFGGEEVWLKFEEAVQPKEPPHLQLTAAPENKDSDEDPEED